MLLELNIRNFALIDKLTITFRSGFSALTGETGAGKSVIIGALGQVLGERSGPDLIRDGEDRALVEARFDISNLTELQEVLQELNISAQDGTLTVRKEVFADGKSRCYINHNHVNQSALKRVGDYLVDIHGQHDHQSLFKSDYQRDILDTFAGLLDERHAFSKMYREYQDTIGRLQDLNLDEREKQRRADMLDFALKEIDEAGLQPNEDVRLEQEISILSNYEKIHNAVGLTLENLKESENSTQNTLEKALTALGDVKDVDPFFVDICASLETALFTLEDAVPNLRSYLENTEYDAGRLDELQSRLYTITRLQKKYGTTIPEILAYRDRAALELDSISQSDTQKQVLEQKCEVLKIELQKKANALSTKRKAAARDLEQRIKKELAFLSMDKTKFIISVEHDFDESSFMTVDDVTIKLDRYGIDVIEYLISTNPGEPTKPLRRIASGGELSRIMLSIKTVLNQADIVPLLIFDEIDIGIGGRIADLLGTKLKELSHNKQVLCITHQHQIAAKAATHYLVRKAVQNDRTFTHILPLSGEKRVREVARMMGGTSITETTLEHARELLA